VAMELSGVPAVYFHSLTASRNNYAGVEKTGRARSINRYKWNEAELENRLMDSGSTAAQVLKAYTHRLKIRSQNKVFHPDAAQRIIDLGPEWFVVERTWKRQRVVCISNFTDGYQELKIDQRLKPLSSCDACVDLLTGERYMGEGKVIPFKPYQTVWLKA